MRKNHTRSSFATAAIVATISAVLSITATAQIQYVAPAPLGDPSNNGLTDLSPKSKIEDALVELAATGGEIIVMPGTYGIAGEITAGEIRKCVSSVSVDGIIDIGGVAGRMSGGKLRENVSHGMVQGGEAVGGVVGNYSGGELTSNRSTGHAKGYAKAGPSIGARSQ